MSLKLEVDSDVIDVISDIIYMYSHNSKFPCLQQLPAQFSVIKEID